MCEVGMITKRVVRLSRRIFNHRIEMAGSEGFRASRLARLNRELDSLYELISADGKFPFYCNQGLDLIENNKI